MGTVLGNGQATWRRIRGQTLGTVSIIPFLVMGVGRAHAQPVGASVIAGQAQVSSSGATTLINQTTNKTIINWQDFSVGAGASVQFNQPSAASITLNRVTGANISNIEGAVRANGQVWLLNPNGVLIGNNARINVGGLLATTSDIANQDFLERRYNFSGGRNSIVNKGAITASSGGSVVLSAPTVINHGLIQANAGHVVLGGADTFTVDFNGDHLLSYALGANSTGGKVINTGKISAPGGQILLTARAAAGVQDAVVNNTGMVEATSVREENGEIILEAEDGGVANSGTLDASGKGAGETGGTVKVLGKDIAIADDAKVDLSGDAGGGTALIGGNFRGKGSEQHAQTTTIGKATIKADAVTRGDGGKVAVWSDGTTKFAGSISARGGAAGGHGGQVETSGHYLGVADGARVDTGAFQGTPGSWLLDPDFITIATGGSAPVTGQTFSTTGTVTISPGTIVSALASGDVALQANIDITVNDPVSATSSHTLTLDAGHAIAVNATLENAGGSIVLIAGDSSGSGSAQANPFISTTSGAFINASQLVLRLPEISGTIGTAANLLNAEGIDGSGGSIPLVLSVFTVGASAYLNVESAVNIGSTGINVQQGALALEASGDITQQGSGGVTGDQISLSSLGAIGTSSSPISIFNILSGSVIHISVNTGGGDATLVAPLADPVSIDNLGVLANGGVNVAGNFTLNGAHSITQTWGITAADLTLSTVSSGSSITLDDVGDNVSDFGNAVSDTVRFSTDVGGTHTSGNDVLFINQYAGPTTLGLSSVHGDLEVHAGSALRLMDANLGATVSATGKVTLAAGGNISQGPDISDTADWIPILSNGLTAASANGAIVLNNPGNTVIGSVDVQPDPGNPGQFIETPLGIVSLSGVGSIAFTNAAPTVLGALTVTKDVDNLASLDLNITDPSGAPSHSNLYLTSAVNVGDTNSGSALPAGSGTGATTIHTAGDIVNLQGVSQIYGDALNLISDFGNIGGEEPSGGSSYFMAATINTLHLLMTGGDGTFANLSNGASFQVGTGQGGIDVGNSSVLLGADNQYGAGDGTNTAAITQLNEPAGKIIAGSLGVSAGFGGYTIDNPQNQVGAFASYTPGSGVFVNSGNLTISRISGNLFDNGVIPSGDVSITALAGDITVAGNINAATNSKVKLDATGSIIVNANIVTDNAGASSGAGTIILTANDPNLLNGAGTNDTNGIFGAGTLTSRNTYLNVGEGPQGLSGGVGTPSQALALDTVNPDLSPIALSVTTFGGDVYLRALNNVVLSKGTEDGPPAVSVDLRPDTGLTPGAQTGNFTLSGFQTIDQNYGIAVRDLNLSTNSAGAGITLNSMFADNIDPGNQVEGVARFNTADGSVSLVNGRQTALGASSVFGSLTVNAFSTAGDASLTIGDPNGGQVRVRNGALSLFAGTDIAQAANTTISAETLVGYSNGGAIFLDNPHNAITGPISLTSYQFNGISLSNSVDTIVIGLQGNDGDSGLTANASITVNVADPTSATRPSLTVYDTVRSQGAITMVAAGDLTLATGGRFDVSNANLSSSGSDITLAAGGHFINQVGASVLSLGEGVGRWLIYSADPAGDTFGQLNSMNTAIFGITYPTGVSASGNRYVFAQGGTLTIAATNASKVYGVDDSAALSTGYIVTVTNAGDFPEAFLPSSDAVSFRGAPQISSLGSGSGAHVGSFDITASLGSLQVSGYQLVFVKGTLTVTPALLTYTANPASRAYGATNPVFAGTVTGFVNGDTLAKATSGTLVFASAANALTGVGSYAINGSGLSAGDYVLAQAANNATGLNITPATLLYLANAASRAQGNPNPVFSGSVTGFVNNETLASATTGTLVFSTDATLTSVAGRYAINGSGLSAANYIFAQAADNAAALTITAPPVTPPVAPDTNGLDDTAQTVLAGFINGLKLPPLGNTLGNPIGPTDAPHPPIPPPPVLPPPPGGTPFADNNSTADGEPAEEPNSSDQATNEVVASLDGGGAGEGGGAPIIPGMLKRTPPPPPPPVDATTLPAFGNTSLWQ